VTVKEHSLVVLPGREEVPLPCPDLPELVIGVVDAVIVGFILGGGVEGFAGVMGAGFQRSEASGSGTLQPGLGFGGGAGTCRRGLKRGPPLPDPWPPQAHESVTAQETVAAWEEERRVSK
jgi:hypothetical protein